MELQVIATIAVFAIVLGLFLWLNFRSTAKPKKIELTKSEPVQSSYSSYGNGVRPTTSRPTPNYTASTQGAARTSSPSRSSGSGSTRRSDSSSNYTPDYDYDTPTRSTSTWSSSHSSSSCSSSWGSSDSGSSSSSCDSGGSCGGGGGGD